MKREYKVGDKVKVRGLNQVGIITDIEIYEDDDGVDEELGCVCIRRIPFYHIVMEDGIKLELRENFELVEEKSEGNE